MSLLTPIAERLRRFLQHPTTGMAIGLVLFGSGLDDLLEAYEAGLTDLSVHHGMIVFGSFKMLGALAEALERASKVAERVERDRGARHDRPTGRSSSPESDGTAR